MTTPPPIASANVAAPTATVSDARAPQIRRESMSCPSSIRAGRRPARRTAAFAPIVAMVPEPPAGLTAARPPSKRVHATPCVRARVSARCSYQPTDAFSGAGSTREQSCGEPGTAHMHL